MHWNSQPKPGRGVRWILGLALQRPLRKERAFCQIVLFNGGELFIVNYDQNASIYAPFAVGKRFWGLLQPCQVGKQTLGRLGRVFLFSQLNRAHLGTNEMYVY